MLVRLADVAPASAAFWRCVYALPFLAVFALLERRNRGRLDRRRYLLALSAGVLFAVDLELWHHPIAAVGPASRGRREPTGRRRRGRRLAAEAGVRAEA